MSLTDHDRDRLRRAIALAAKGRFAVEPNPSVGCVLEKDGQVVGEGWHVAYGGPHAEVEALRRAGDAARGATAYVSLEPCSKVLKTGACATALREAGVKRVVYAARDPNMAADGLAGLAAAGIQVDGPALASEADPLLDRFRESLTRRRPQVVLKWAMSADGRIAPARNRGGAISGARSHTLVHDMRAHADAVAVGARTVGVDDPQLTCRLEGGPPDDRPQPLRVVFDEDLATTPSARLFADAPSVPVVLFAAVGVDGGRRAALEGAGAEVVEVPRTEAGVDLTRSLEILHERGVGRLLVEGGANVHGSFLKAGLADQVAVFVAPLLLGGADAPAAVTGTDVTRVEQALRLTEPTWRRLDRDLLLQGYVSG